MSNGRRLRRSLKRGAQERREPDVLDRIIAAAPNVPGYGGGKWAMYAVGCCWWTSNPADLGRANLPTMPASPLPSCPYCLSVLMQAPLEDFCDNARRNAEHYGTRGLATFAAAHAAPCNPSWEGYE